jgi:hypothetical protein
MADRYDGHDMVEERVERRMAAIKVFIAHAVLSLGLFYLLILGGALGQASLGVVIVVTLILLASVLAHGIWLGMKEKRLSITRQEMARQRLFEEAIAQSEKPKRDGSRLALTDDGELEDLLVYESDGDSDDTALYE